ncbi:FmdB family zinc ribbon protein [Thermodesulfobacteriota bacterium]
MPLYDFKCRDCGRESEKLITLSDDVPECAGCGSMNLDKMMSVTSSFSGNASAGFPGADDTGCCGSNPSDAGCAGPGSCCGRKL